MTAKSENDKSSANGGADEKLPLTQDLRSLIEKYADDLRKVIENLRKRLH